LCDNWVTNLEVVWEQPRIEQLHRRLATFSRLIIFDKRGTGISDPIPSQSLSMVPTIEEGTNDAVTVLDNLGVGAVAVLGADIGCWVALQLAAMFASRVSHLVLVDPLPRLTRTDDYPFAMSSAAHCAYIADIRHNYARNADSTMLRFLAPDLAEDQHLKEWMLRYHRLGMPPGVMLANWEGTGDVDLRPLLGSIHTPTLVLEHEEPPFRSHPGQYVAGAIAPAVYREIPGRNPALWAPQAEWVFDEIETFITGTAPVRRTTGSERFLTTLLFTDIVDSTRIAGRLGDKAWLDQLDLHDATVRSLVEDYRGELVKHTGDGVLANFDGPARAVRCGYALRERLAEIGLRTRIGLHTGEVESRGGNLGGIGVHLAARVLGICEADEVLVSRTVRDLVTGSGIEFEDRGVHSFKGIDEGW
jgi:class 3 adenylate cyclase/pimeloyl-ACP methyl ester carboxylesterase